MKKKQIVFDLNSLLKLLTHYTDGMVPKDAEAVNFGPHTYLQNWFGVWCKAKKWPHSEREIKFGGLTALVVRYEGKKVLTMNEKGQSVVRDGPEAPKKV